MKSIFVLILLSMQFISCSSLNTGIKYDFMEPNARVNSSLGYLKIYSHNFLEKGTAPDDPAYNVYKGYTVYSDNGEYIMDVEKSYNKPHLISLNAGEYIIIVELSKNIISSLPVKIEAGKILEITSDMVEEVVSNTQEN